jgi:hypothetical protein
MKGVLGTVVLAMAISEAPAAHACGGLLRDSIDPNCKPPPPMVWSKPKATQAEFAQTRYRCM